MVIEWRTPDQTIEDVLKDRPIFRVTVDRDGDLAWDGEPLKNLAALEAKFAEFRDHVPRIIVHIVPTKDTRYEQVCEIARLMQQYRIGSGMVGLMQPEPDPLPEVATENPTGDVSTTPVCLPLDPDAV